MLEREWAWGADEWTDGNDAQWYTFVQGAFVFRADVLIDTDDFVAECLVDTGDFEAECFVPVLPA